MEDESRYPHFEYVRMDRWPSMFCPGCGLGTVMSAFLSAVHELGLDPRKVALVCGIGCTGRLGGYMNFDSIHVTHGRAIPVALGARLVREDVRFVAFVGDGDGASIGGNHLIHAAQRDLDIMVVMVNNMVYGLTGGQMSPTTPAGMRTTTTPRGSVGRGMDISRLVAAAGASYVARWTSMHPRQLKNAMTRALSRHGFSFIEVLAQCPEELGERNEMKSPSEMMRWILRGTTRGDPRAAGMSPRDKLLIGELVNRDTEGEPIAEPAGVAQAGEEG